MNIISLSDVAAFKKCRKYWDYSSHMRQSLRPSFQAPHFWLGTGVHFAIENAYKTFRTIPDLFQDYREATERYYGCENVPANIEELMSTGINIVENFIVSDIYKSLNIIDTEVPFEVCIASNSVLRGIFDAIHEDEFENIWIVDYKTTKSFVDRKSLILNDQVNGYLLAASKIFGQRVAGFKYIEIKKAPLGPPVILSNGDVSISKSQNTTYALYKDAALVAYGGEQNIPESRKKFMEYLLSPEYGHQFIRQTEIPVPSTGALDNYERELSYVIRDMVHPGAQIYRSPAKQCSQCVYFGLCTGTQTTDEHQGLIHSNYEDRSGWAKYINWYDGKEERDAIRGILRKAY